MDADESFARELRALADTSVHGAHITGVDALATVKRRTRTRRIRQAALSVVGAVVIGAGVVGLSVAQTPDIDVTPAEPTATTSETAADIDLTPAPGITQMPSDARTYERHDGVTIVDSSLDSWIDGESFVFALHPATSTDDPPPQVGVYSLTAVELAGLIDTPALPDADWFTLAGAPSTMRSEDGTHSLVFAWTTSEPWRIALEGYVPLSDGRSLQAFPTTRVESLTATGWGTTFDLFAARFDASPGAPLPAVRAMVHFNAAGTSGGNTECTDTSCNVTWNEQTVTAAPAPQEEHPATTSAAHALATLEQFKIPTSDDILTTCTTARAAWEDEHGITGREIDRTTQCHLDVRYEYDRRLAAQEDDA